MKKIWIVVLLLVVLCGCEEEKKEVNLVSLGKVLVRIIAAPSNENPSILFMECDYFKKSGEKYLIKNFVYMGYDKFWVNKNASYHISRHSLGAVFILLWDDSKSKRITPKVIYVLEPRRCSIFKVVGGEVIEAYVIKETDRCYFVKLANGKERWIAKNPLPEWFGNCYGIWEDGDRVKEGKLVQ